jgi:hypothetical protein
MVKIKNQSFVLFVSFVVKIQEIRNRIFNAKTERRGEYF